MATDHALLQIPRPGTQHLGCVVAVFQAIVTSASQPLRAAVPSCRCGQQLPDASSLLCRTQGLLRHLRAAAAGQHQQQRGGAGRVQPCHQGESACDANDRLHGGTSTLSLAHTSHRWFGTLFQCAHQTCCFVCCRTCLRRSTMTASDSPCSRPSSCLPASSCSCARSAARMCA